MSHWTRKSSYRNSASNEARKKSPQA